MARSHPHSWEYELSDVPGFWLRFLLSPVLLPYTMALGIYDHMEGTSKLDRHETALFSAAWSGGALMSWGYHAYMFPAGHFSGFMTGSAAARTAVYLAPAVVASAAIVLGVNQASGAAYDPDSPTYAPRVVADVQQTSMDMTYAALWFMGLFK